jgi:hypothetical protein
MKKAKRLMIFRIIATAFLLGVGASLLYKFMSCRPDHLTKVNAFVIGYKTTPGSVGMWGRISYGTTDPIYQYQIGDTTFRSTPSEAGWSPPSSRRETFVYVNLNHPSFCYYSSRPYPFDAILFEFAAIAVVLLAFDYGYRTWLKSRIR